MNETCAVCNETHESFARTMPDGSTHVLQTAAELERRTRATIAAKVRINAALGVESPVMAAYLAGRLPEKTGL